MAYQHFTVQGSGGFSKVNNPPTRTGSITAVEGDGWVRFLHSATTGVTTGANENITDPSVDDPSFVDGWAWLPMGGTITFGTERIHESTDTEPIGQIDIFADGEAIIVINAH